MFKKITIAIVSITVLLLSEYALQLFGVHKEPTVPIQSQIESITVQGEGLDFEEYKERTEILVKVWEEMGYDLGGTAMNDTYSKVLNELLRNMIHEKVIEVKAKELGLTVSQEDIEKNMTKQDKESKDVSKELVQRQVKIQLLKQKLSDKLYQDVNVTDEEVKDYYEKNKDRFTELERVKMKQILVNKEEVANEVHSKLQNGTPFETLVKEYSIEDITSAEDGLVGTFSKGVLLPEIENVAFSLEIGKVSNIIQTPFGFHIVKVEEKLPKEILDFEEVKEDITQMLKQKQVETILSGYYKKAVKNQ